MTAGDRHHIADAEQSWMATMLSPPSGQTPMYNELWGFSEGAQNDIFQDSSDSPTPLPLTTGT